VQLVRPAFALHPFRFGRGRIWLLGDEQVIRPSLPEDVKLFAATFAAGFLFVSILIG
jgi:hypothetical protein